jgi:hypothetical protein
MNAKFRCLYLFFATINILVPMQRLKKSYCQTTKIIIMKNNFSRFSAAFIITALLVFGCKKQSDENNKCLSFSKSPVTAVTGATTGSINQDIALTVSFKCNNGCGQFGSFEQVRTGNTFEISVIAKYEGCLCTQDIPLRQQVYTFRAGQAGSYQLNFVQPGGAYITHTITVL